MRVRKAGKILLGADLTNEESKVLNMEIQKRIAEYDRNNVDEIDAMVLWNLHLIFGFGEERLMKFYNSFSKDLHAMCERYELTDEGDELWVCMHKLKEKFGIDVHQLNDKFR